jgi:hypothetical protein
MAVSPQFAPLFQERPRTPEQFPNFPRDRSESGALSGRDNQLLDDSLERDLVFRARRYLCTVTV